MLLYLPVNGDAVFALWCLIMPRFLVVLLCIHLEPEFPQCQMVVIYEQMCATGHSKRHLIAYLLCRFGMQANMKHVAQQQSALRRATWTQTSGFLVKWLPRNSGEQRVLHCRTMGSCLGCRGPSFNQTALQQQWKDCVCVHRQCFIHWHKVGLRLPLIPLKHNLGWASSGYITNSLADRGTHSLSQVFSWNLFASHPVFFYSFFHVLRWHSPVRRVFSRQHNLRGGANRCSPISN